MGRKVAAVGLDKFQPKATEIMPATQSSPIIWPLLSQVIDIWLLWLVGADGEGVISPCAGPASWTAFGLWHKEQKNIQGRLTQWMCPQTNLSEETETG